MTDSSPPDRMPDEPAEPAVTEASRRIASGESVDWPTMESSVGDDESRATLDRLKKVQAIATFHRGLYGHAPPPPEQMLAAWGSLRIVSEIGRGSFGQVFRAWDPALEREVALKVLDPRVASDSSSARAVIDEGRRLAKLRHRNIVSIHRAERIDDSVALEMELVVGRTLAQIVTERGAFAADEAALICRDLSRALAAVHSAGLIHRDVKAQNVIREVGGRVVLMDFGAGRPSDSVSTSGIAGTPLYLAPEVLAGGSPTPKSDLYSLGVLLYYLVTGSFPFLADSLDELRAAHESRTVRRLRDARPDLPERFIQLVERALDPNPANRIDSAATFETELSRLLGSADRPAPARKPAFSGVWPTVAGVAILWAIAVSLYRFWPIQEASPPTAADQSIAVLPFVSRSGSGDDEYFADGMTDELIAMLGKVPGLKVAARTSAFAFKRKTTGAGEIARQLGVRKLLEGVVRRTGTDVRVTASLVNADDGLQVWSDSFESPAGDVFAVQDSIARAVVHHLSLRLGGPALRASQAGRTQDHEAYDLYLRGLAAANAGTEAEIRRALDFYQRALARDPQFARAYAGIASVNLFLADAYEPSNKAYAAARSAALAALERDELLAEAHAILGYSAFALEWDGVSAERRYRRGLEIDPNSALAHAFLGLHLCGLGRVDEARTHQTRSLALDPLSPLLAWIIEWCHYMDQDPKAGLAAHQRTQSIGPGFWYLDSLAGAAHRELGDYAASVREYEKTPLAKMGAPQYGLAFTYIRMGRLDEARKIVRKLDEQLAKGQYVPLLYLGALHGALGDLDRGVALLQQSFDNRELLLVGKRKLELKELLRDPRAQRIIERAEAIWKPAR